MAERSMEERIELWYAHQQHALKMTQLDWLIHVTATGPRASAEDYVIHAQTFVEGMERRNAWLVANPAERAQDRLDASREQADRALAAFWESRQEAEVEPLEYDALEPEEDYEADDYEEDGRRLIGPLPEPDYPTQYEGMGSAPDRIEIDASDEDMGGRWQEQLAALDARLEALLADSRAHEYEQSY